MPTSCIVLEDLGHGQKLIRITSGCQAGTELVVVRRALTGVRRLEDIVGEKIDWVDPDAVAERLLISLLDPKQRAEWDASRTFCVDTERGQVQFGQVHNMRFKPTAGHPIRLCVVPDDHRSLPVCDIWTNLLLVLRGDPDRFFCVANWQRGQGQWHAGPVPFAANQGQ